MKTFRGQTTAKKGALLSTSNSRRARQALPPSQIEPVLGEVVEVLAKQALESQRGDDFDTSVILDIHKTLSAELAAAYQLLSQPGIAEAVWGGEFAKGLAEAIRRNDDKYVDDYRNSFWKCIQPDKGRKKLSEVTYQLAWAVFVESALLNERLIEDMRVVSTEKGCPCLPAHAWLPFFGPCPPPEARQAFQEYVACRWPTHVFALDPINQEQNIADEFSRRRETQLAIATAFMTGNMNASTFTRYSRRLESDMATIALHRTAVGFTKGPNHFGWRFTPRFQSPPVESNLTVLSRDLIFGGPTRNQDLRQTQIEPGTRECIALVIMPTIVSNITLDTSSHWFCLTNPKVTGPHIKQTMRMSESIQRLQDCTAALRDSPCYRAGEASRLLQRVNQLSAGLPLQTFSQQVPYENTLGGFSMFTSGITDLAPQLYGFYGRPGVKLGAPTDLILVGNHFSVRDTQVMAGNRICNFDLISRRVMRITVPADAQPNNTKQKDAAGKDIHVVDIHVMGPYGATARLPVPVVESQPETPSTKFTWGLPKIYRVGYTFTPDPLKPTPVNAVVKLPGNLLPATNEMSIDAPAGMLFPTGTSSLTLTLADGNKVVFAKDINVTFDFQRNRFVLFGPNFATANTELSTALIAHLQNLNAGNVPVPPDRTLTLTGRLFINGNTFAIVESSVIITLGKQ